MSSLVSLSRRLRQASRALQHVLFIGLAALVVACDDGTAPVPVPMVQQVIIEPGPRAMTEGDTLRLVARAFDANGAEITGRPVTWTTTNADAATVSTSGVATATGEGNAEIRATIDGKWDVALLAVSRAPVASVTINASQVTLIQGGTQSLVATATDASGRVLTNRQVFWSSNNGSVVTVDANGILTAIQVGSTTVTATIETVEAVVTVSVIQAPVASVTVTPGAAVIEVGEQRQYFAVVKDQWGNVLTDRVVQWSVTGGVATITQAGVVTGTGNGYITVSAKSEAVSVSVGATIVPPDPYDWDLLYHRVNGSGESEIFTLTLGGGALPVRLNAGTVSRGGTASPDGSRIAFAVSMDDFATGGRVDDLFAVDRNGMNMKRLTSEPGLDDSPDWSPTGAKIAWVHWELDGRADIWVMNPDGNGKVNLTADMPASGARREPAWSRDGSRIAFAQYENGPAGTTASIWVMQADGSGKQQLTSTLTGFDNGPTWSPDGQRIAFVRNYSGFVPWTDVQEFDITIIDVNSGALTRLPVPGYEQAPSWSPDGALIAFSTNDRLYTMRPDGNQLRLRTYDPTWGGGLAPTWIPRQQ